MGTRLGGECSSLRFEKLPLRDQIQKLEIRLKCIHLLLPPDCARFSCSHSHSKSQNLGITCMVVFSYHSVFLYWRHSQSLEYQYCKKRSVDQVTGIDSRGAAAEADSIGSRGETSSDLCTGAAQPSAGLLT